MKESSNNKKPGKLINLSKVSPDEIDYTNDATFLKRAQEAKEFTEQVGFPEDLLKIRKAMYGK